MIQNASGLQRIIAFLVDVLFLSLFIYPLKFIWFLTGNLLMLLLFNKEIANVAGDIYLVGISLLLIGIYSLFEYKKNSIGKVLVGIQVRGELDNKLHYREILIRNILRYSLIFFAFIPYSWLALLLIFIFMCLNSRKQSIIDILLHTQVIKTQRVNTNIS